MRQHETKHYRVTTKHPRGWQDGAHEFRVSTTHAAGDDGSGTMPLAWYAVAPRFGCSKNYMSPTLAIRAMCAEHACEVVSLVEYDPASEARDARQANERKIVARAIADLITAGYYLAWYDVTDGPAHTDQAALMAEYAACDDMVLNVCNSPTLALRNGWVQFVYGNDDGSTVLCDYTVNLESALAGAIALSDEIAG
jgi:hypothetical protein